MTAKMLGPARLTVAGAGEHMGLAWNAQRVTGTDDYVITISGWFGGQHTLRQIGMKAATRSKVRHAVEAHHGEMVAAKAKWAARGQR